MADLARFIRDAPPGELEAVKKATNYDIDILTNGSHAVSSAVAKQVEQYNVENLRIVKIKGRNTVLCKYNQLSDSEFFSNGVKFSFDHATGTVSEIESYKQQSSAATKLYKEVEEYVEDHYPSENAFDVFDSDEGLAVVIVGRRLSPRNYFNGQWSSQYVVSGNSIKGSIAVDVHYFEEGNVRLRSKTAVDESGSNTVTAIVTAEDNFETELNKSLVGLNESEFKALRRQLPVTRSQMVWGKAVNNYKLGRELENR